MISYVITLKRLPGSQTRKKRSITDLSGLISNTVQQITGIEPSISDNSDTVSFSEEIDACVSNPCSNSGECIDLLGNDDTVTGRNCVCRPGFSGENCGTDVDDCLAEPCLNGGACVDAEDAYFCECSRPWSGKDCEIDVFCHGDSGNDVNDCNGNGVCFAGMCECDCFEDFCYTGSYCAVANGCLQLGTARTDCPVNSVCIDMGFEHVCQCDVGFSGVDCDIYVCDAACGENCDCEVSDDGRPVCLDCSTRIVTTPEATSDLFFETTSQPDSETTVRSKILARLPQFGHF